MKEVWLVRGYDYDSSSVIAVYATPEEAERERAYCEEMSKTHNGFHENFAVERYVVGESEALLLVRTNAAAEVTAVDFFTMRVGDMVLGRVRHYEELWEDGTCIDATARTVEEGAALCRAALASQPTKEAP